MFRILEQQAPAKQTASDTINTLSGRLQSATLLEDRRAAILGLRSFAKLYPASVASGALRNLITSLSTDGEDVDTNKIVLETLLMLFSPDASSPEASDEIALWLADEFTQRQDNITVLLDLVEKYDFFCRLYSLQLISAILSARPERTQECIYTAPLGVSRLVALLEDKREAIQGETVLLLVSLTPSSPELQKLVAYEGAFDRIFAIIDSEGSLTRGGVVVQDCLSLLANLLRLNISNQSHFRETGGIPKAANLLRMVLKEESGESDNPDLWASPQKEKNIWGFLSVIRLFLQGGGAGTQMNQVAFWQHGVTFAALDIGFSASMSPPIRSEALFTCADLIRGNGSLQEKLAQRDVTMHLLPERTPSSTPKPTINGKSEPARIVVNVIQALIDVSLAVSVQEPLDVRLAACECLKAYLQGHAPIRHFFLKRAREGHLSNEPEVDNIFTILINDSSGGPIPDPYRLWIASVLLLRLLYDDYDAKKVAMDISEGDAEQGEEVVTCIQALSANLISNATRGKDDRITVAYLTLLCGWLFEDPEAINDFLQEGSNVQNLIQLVLQTNQQRALESGLCAFLLGIIYEFSSKDSPIPRSKLHELLTSRLGRDQYNDRLTKLREHPSIRDFEVLPLGYIPDSYGGQPDIPFDKLFVEFLKDNFSRISRSLDREPGMEVPVIANGVQRGISRELVDSLRAQLDEKSSVLHKAQSTVINLEQKLEQEQAELRKVKESTAVELSRIKNINDGLQRNHEQETKELQRRYEEEKHLLHQNRTRELADQQRMYRTESDRLAGEHRKALAELQSSLSAKISAVELEKEALKQQYESASARAVSQHQAEIGKLSTRIKAMDVEAARSSEQYSRDLQTTQDAHNGRMEEQKRRLAEQERRFKELEDRLRTAEARVGKAEAQAAEAEKLVHEKEAARASTQTELDDLFMVLADLEEKRAKDKERLKALGEEVSGPEDNDEEDEEEEEEDEEEEDDEEGEEEDGEDDGEEEKGNTKAEKTRQSTTQDDVD